VGVLKLPPSYDYEGYAAFLGSKDDRPLANNTRVIRWGAQVIKIRLHNTSIIWFNQNGDISLYTGGWKTNTTRNRLSRFTPFWGVGSTGGIWYVYPRWSQERFAFYEGITFKERDYR